MFALYALEPPHETRRDYPEDVTFLYTATKILCATKNGTEKKGEAGARLLQGGPSLKVDSRQKADYNTPERGSVVEGDDKIGCDKGNH